MTKNRKKFLCYMLSALAPQIMLIFGIVWLTKNSDENKKLGLRVCQISLSIMVLGSFIYYIFFTPIFGLD